MRALKSTASAQKLVSLGWLSETDLKSSSDSEKNPLFKGVGFDWRLPGHGNPYEDCGEWLYRGCLETDQHLQNELLESVANKAYVEIYMRSCRRADCPICYEKWAGLEASRIEWRVKHAWKNGKPIHVVLSPPPSEVLEKPFSQIRSHAYQVAKNRGLLGGCAIYHPWREDSFGMWYFAPHFHVIGYGWIRNTAQGYKKDGWIVKNVLDDAQEKYKDKQSRSVFQTALYQLSHCGISDHAQPVTWFGCLSSAGKNRFACPPMPKEEHVCPCCGRVLVSLRCEYDVLPEFSEKPHAWLSPEGWRQIGRSPGG